jgi:hypothetical protein
MKAKDLMIGDWVVQDDNLHKNRVCQITGIYDNVIVDVTGEKVPLHESHIEPIPLTTEILEKNFEKKGTRYGIFDDYFDFEVREYNDGMFIVNYHCCEMSLPDTQIDSICHVHQLQHAMNICGVEKEITL